MLERGMILILLALITLGSHEIVFFTNYPFRFYFLRRRRDTISITQIYNLRLAYFQNLSMPKLIKVPFSWSIVEHDKRCLIDRAEFRPWMIVKSIYHVRHAVDSRAKQRDATVNRSKFPKDKIMNQLFSLVHLFTFQFSTRRQSRNKRHGHLHCQMRQ